MSCHRVLVAVLIAHAASGQSCDERYPWTCPGYVGPSPQSIRPGAPLPIEITPNLQPTELAAPPRSGETAWTLNPAAQ
jgi:hypothetical protein